jgi:hypothetical protein
MLERGKECPEIRDLLGGIIVWACFGGTYSLRLKPWRWRQYVVTKHWNTGIYLQVHRALLPRTTTWYRRVGLYADTNVSDEHTASTYSPEDGGSMSFRNVGTYLQIHTAFKPRIPKMLTPFEPVGRHQLLRGTYSLRPKPWRWRQHVLPKRRCLATSPRDVTTEKTNIAIRASLSETSVL